jgi:Domain of unknown function (DUF1857)
MIYSTATVPVNPQGETALTRDQLWQGLVLKARDARLFLPPGACTKCDVVVDAKDYLIREATIMGDDLSEIVAFEAQTKVSFFQRSGPKEGVIVNQILEDAHGVLTLKFYCLLGLRDHAPDGPEEQREKAQLDSAEHGYKAALLSTLARTRQLVSEGKIGS